MVCREDLPAKIQGQNDNARKSIAKRSVVYSRTAPPVSELTDRRRQKLFCFNKGKLF